MRQPSALYVILVGGGIAGAIDITYAITFSHFRGLSAIRPLQSVASKVYGVGIYAVMNLIFLPLSAYPRKVTFAPLGTMTGLQTC